MTLRFTEGFDILSVTDGRTYNKWSNQTFSFNGISSVSRALVTGRFGHGSAYHMTATAIGNTNANQLIQFQLAADATTLFLGFALKDAGTATANTNDLFGLYDTNQATQVDIRISAGRNLTVTRNGTVLCTSSNTVSAGIWMYIELGVFVSPTAGWAELRTNGTLVASYYGTTGTNRANSNGNTRSSASSTLRFAQIGGNLTGNPLSLDYTYDDIYLSDTAGANNTDFLGDIEVIGLLPVSSGTNSGFTRTGGSAGGNYTAVNETPVDGDTSYVSSSAPGTTDTYTFGALPLNVSGIRGVNFQPIGRKDATGNRTLTTRVRAPDAVEADAAAVALTLSPSYQTALQIEEVSPRTGVAWTITDIGSGEFGPKIAS